MTETFYRVGHNGNQQGLWYTPAGHFVGSIHNELNFCVNSSLKMPFDPEICGYLSATKTIDELLLWFPIADILMLECRGYSIMRYEATDFKEYANHWIINQKTSKLVELICSDQINIGLREPVNN